MEAQLSTALASSDSSSKTLSNNMAVWNKKAAYIRTELFEYTDSVKKLA